MLGFDHTQGEFPDMWTLSENLSTYVYTVFVSKHYYVFSVRQRSQYLAINLSFFLYAPFEVKCDIFVL